MAKHRQMASLLLLGMLLGGGCGSPPVPPSRTRVGPHNGIATQLPDEPGFAEIVNEPEVSNRGSTQATSIVVYFLQPDGKTPMAPLPTDVRAEVNLGLRRTESLPMKVEPKAGDPSSSSRFASKPGPYLLQNIRGQLYATVGNRKIELVFAGGR